LVTSGAILISAGVAVCAILYNAKLLRQRATIDLVMYQRKDEALNKAKRKVLTLHDSTAQFARYALKEHFGTEENDAILTVLNAHEFVAVGVREGSFDEKTYKRLRWSSLVRDWDALETYVAELRKSRGRPTLFQEFELLAKRWKKIPLKVEEPQK
jgi:hypothetical protein